MKILAAVMYVPKIKFFKNSMHLPIEERRVKKRTPMRFLVYDPSKVTPCDYEKKTKAWLEE